MRVRKLVLILTVAGSVVGLTGCPDPESRAGDTPGDTLTRRQRDSIVGESSLPGARGVKTMLEASDRQKARADRLDSLSKNR